MENEKRLIDANEVIRSMQRVIDEENNPNSLGCRVMREVIKGLELTPTVDAVEVVHGRWLDIQETETYVPDMKFTITKTAETCSNCKARIGFVGAKQYLFDAICPSCGAKMDGERKDNG